MGRTTITKKINMKKTTLLLLLMLSNWMGAFFAQSYPEDREKFSKYVKTIFKESGNYDADFFAKEILTPALLESQMISDAQFKQMVAFCNVMESKKLKDFPNIYQYLYGVFFLIKDKQPNTVITDYHQAIQTLIDRKNNRKLDDFLSLTSSFFAKREFSDKKDFHWYYRNGTYSFQNEKDKPMILLKGGDLFGAVDNMSKKSKKENPYSDSVVVTHTEGAIDILGRKFYGKGGQINWEKAKLDKNTTYATVNDYSFSLGSNEVKFDSVLLVNTYFPKPVLGRIVDKAVNDALSDEIIYPQFFSQEKTLRIENIKPDVDYLGPFVLKGNKLIGQGSANDLVQIIVKRNGLRFVKIRSEYISISDEKILSNGAHGSMFFNTGDSISHPSINFTYDLKKSEVTLSRPKIGAGQAPFTDSYHQLDIYVSQITWNTQEKDIFFDFEYGTSQEQKIARFESKNYYDEGVFQKFQGLSNVNVLSKVYAFCYKYDEFVMNEGRFATALSMTVEQAKTIMLELAMYGFITYDQEAKMVTVNQKLENFVLGKEGKKDYDNIAFIADMRPKELKGYSEEQIRKDPYLQAIQQQYFENNEYRRNLKYFGKMDLGSLVLDLNAIDMVTLSEKQNVVLFPDRSEVSVKENRNFEFNGWINAGKMEINTLSANYNYRENKINLFKTDKSLFRLSPLQKEDGTKAIPMVTRISSIKGELYVDDVKNRSGLNKAITDYPKIVVNKPSMIFYNDEQIFRGAYDSTRFYYTIEPFAMDSLDNFDQKQLKLKGELTSAGIFPAFKEDLVIMPDYSFGFSKQAPAEGYTFYGTSAKYKNKIILSGNGLQGAGTINFVHSTSISKGLNFLPDSAIGYAQFDNKPIETGVQFPDVTSKRAYITYLPKTKMLKVASTPDEDLSFFDKQAKMKGTAIVTPAGMRGFGLLSFKTATTVSQDYNFNRWEINADTAGFNLKNVYATKGEDPLAFQATNVKAKISFKDRIGEFKSNKGKSQIYFPVNQYLCKMQSFDWNMDEEQIQLNDKNEKDVTINTDIELEGPNLFSTNPSQDSLRFRSPKAKYDLKQKSIFCEQVEFIEVADARIYPDSMKTVIRKAAQLDSLKNAKIVTNFVTKYHTFIKSDVVINGKKSFSGSGKYFYRDYDSVATLLTVDRIYVDSSLQTVSKGTITQDMQFKLSKEFDFYGNYYITASKPFMTFDGATKVNHNCTKFDRNWMAFKTEIDPKNIQIPVSDKMKDMAGNSISAGILWRDAPSLDSLKLYPTFLSSVISEKDPVVLTSSGYLQYNHRFKEFQIGSKEKLLNKTERGSFLALSVENCAMSGEGIINLGLDTKEVKIETVGTMNYSQENDQTLFNLTAKISMKVDKGSFEKIATGIKETEGLKMVDFTTTTLEQAMVEWVDRASADKIKSDYTIQGVMKKVPRSMDETFVLTGLKLASFNKRNFEEKGLISNTNQVGLVNIYGEPVMKYIPYKAFFQQIYSGGGSDKFGLLFEIPGGKDYYFDYAVPKKDGELKIITTDEKLIDNLSTMKDDKRKSKDFYYEISTQQVYKSKFKRLFE